MAQATDQATVLAGHWGQLERLEELEHAIEQSAAAIVDLEVDLIEADTVTSEVDFAAIGMDRDTAIRLATLRMRREQLRQGLDDTGESDEVPLERWQQGREHLREWLNSGDTGTPKGPDYLRLVMGVLNLAALVAAFTVHLAFLILLIPLGATSAFLWSGDDKNWQRMAAKRAYDADGLKAPREWTETGVAARLAELEADIEAAQQSTALATDRGIESMSPEAIALEIVDNEVAEQAMVADWDALPAATRTALTRLAEADAVRRELARLRRSRQTLDAQAEGLRNTIYRYLQREHGLELQGRSDIEYLRTGLEQVAAAINTG